MKIALLSTYCGHGGAAVANDRLAAALRSMGHDVTQISAGGTRHRVAFVAERADIFARNGFNRTDLFKVSTARFGQRISQIPAVKEADVVVLGWVNQGFAQLDDLEQIEAPMVWLMHDMWALTGICHHAYECRRYEHQCGRCQFIHRRPRENDLSRQVRRAKEQLYGRRPIRFVAVSRWLAECAQRSSLLRGADVSVIPNIFDFEANPMKRTGETHIAMGAARLDDPIKGLPIAIEALNHLADHRPELARRAPLLLFGSVRNHRALDSLRYPHTMLGPVANSMEVLSCSAVVLSTSLYETFGLTLLEGLAAGCIPVTFGNSGQAEVVSHLRNGYVAESRSALSIAKGIEWALTQSSLTPEALRAEAARRFSPEAVGRQWDALLQNLCH